MVFKNGVIPINYNTANGMLKMINLWRGRKGVKLEIRPTFFVRDAMC